MRWLLVSLSFQSYSLHSRTVIKSLEIAGLLLSSRLDFISWTLTTLSWTVSLLHRLLKNNHLAKADEDRGLMYVWYTYDLSWHHLLQANKYLVIMKQEPGIMFPILQHRTFYIVYFSKLLNMNSRFLVFKATDCSHISPNQRINSLHFWQERWFSINSNHIIWFGAK